MKRIATLVLALALAGPARADEGMWTFDDFPSDRVAKRYGFSPDAAWLDHVRLASARLANGCSASFVSPEGLVLTNHHCVHACVEQLSTPEEDLVENGFLARRRQDERRCPAMEVNQLLEIRDVTKEIGEATRGKRGKAFADALKAEKARLEKACATSDSLRCEVVTLYAGGKYDLYKYRRYQDVRLVFAPEIDIAFFGGDPDNFTFPRYNLDMAFLRVWEEGAPAKTEHYFAWDEDGAKPGELTFVSGHPGRTSRLYTVSQLAFERDVALPARLFYLAELRGVLTEFSRRGEEQARIAKTPLFYVENAFKALRGRHKALVDETLFASKVEEERKLRAWVEADAERNERWGEAWDLIDRANDRLEEFYEELVFVEGPGRGGPWGIRSQLFDYARTLVRAAAELQKPNEQRLPEYTDANLPALRARLFSEAPIYPQLEEVQLVYSLTKLREALGTDHPIVQRVLGEDSPESLAAQLAGSKLADPKERRRLFEGGAKAIADSKDPMIALARRVDPDARAVRARYEAEVDAVERRAGEQIAQARFAAFGTEVYPDATFTLRLSYGAVEGWKEGGRTIEPITVFAGLYDRATGKDPYELPSSWRKARSKLDLQTPYNFVTTNDIIGGNSGSPVIDRDARIVGLIFDGNLPSLGGEYGFDPTSNRAVAVHGAGMLEALRTVYGADAILEEIRRAR